MLACNVPGAAQSQDVGAAVSAVLAQTAIAAQTQAAALTASAPLPTLAPPTDTPMPTLTPTPTIPIAWPKDLPVNCRFGPGLGWLVTSGLLVGDTAPIQGRNADSSWWLIVTKLEPGAPCWVAASATLTAGNMAAVPVVASPHASVTSVDLGLSPKNQSLPGCFGPPQLIKFSGSITTNGPTKVEWYFETEEGGDMPSHTLNFDGFGTKSVEGSYLPASWPGTFGVSLVVFEPDNEQIQRKYKINC
jgi:hypothetical protein